MEELLPHDIRVITCENLFMDKCLRADDKNANASITFFLLLDVLQ